MKIPNLFENQKPKIIGEGLDKILIRIDNNWLKIIFKVNDLTQNQESQSIEYVLVYNFLRDHQIPTFEGSNKSKPAVEYKNGVLKVVNLTHPNHLIYNHHLDSDFTIL
jgi:hypothetical protein